LKLKTKQTKKKLKTNKNNRIIISGGGTGGHIFPAISIAKALKEIDPTIEILFVGALGRMEMEKVPAAGFNIIGLPIMGFQRKLSIKNLKVLFQLLVSLIKAKKIIRSFKPAVAVGVGGYASGPILRIAAKLGIPTVIQEQNSHAGVTNKLLAQKANKICVAYTNMERYFPAEKIILTGNPVRQDLINLEAKKTEAYAYFNLATDKKTILVLGGSLGARTINNSLLIKLGQLTNAGIQIIWQTGSIYYDDLVTKAKPYASDSINIQAFISRMDLAFSVADLVISRAGASTISELCVAAKPAILVPSPNVAEDHQTKNALALVNANAAIMVKDVSAPNILADTALKIIFDDKELKKLSINVSKLAMHDSANKIAGEILNLL
jgi:UDP-N-acetylglucosamine--N-acetylmuramyl-(pentapeptide) pyrophosphoryl-undecaprenol N-acetylglucosamine transferase